MVWAVDFDDETPRPDQIVLVGSNTELTVGGTVTVDNPEEEPMVAVRAKVYDEGEAPDLTPPNDADDFGEFEYSGSAVYEYEGAATIPDDYACGYTAGTLSTLKLRVWAGVMDGEDFTTLAVSSVRNLAGCCSDVLEAAPAPPPRQHVAIGVKGNKKGRRKPAPKKPLRKVPK